MDHRTFGYLQPSAEQLEIMETMRSHATDYANTILEHVPEGPDRTYIIRKLREVAMWVNVAITREANGAPRL